MSRASSRASNTNARDSRTSIARGSGASSPLKRLTHEINDLRGLPNDAVLHLGPASDEDLFRWEAILKGPRDQSSPYCGGLWLLSIEIPPNYPLVPPKIRFVTPICHPNVHFQTGEICLTLLTSEHWAPTYTLSTTMSALQMLLTEPGLDSPLNVDVANLLREDDAVGWEGLVRYWTAEKRWQGEGAAGFLSERAPGTGGHLGMVH